MPAGVEQERQQPIGIFKTNVSGIEEIIVAPAESTRHARVDTREERMPNARCEREQIIEARAICG